MRASSAAGHGGECRWRRCVHLRVRAAAGHASTPLTVRTERGRLTTIARVFIFPSVPPRPALRRLPRRRSALREVIAIAGEHRQVTLSRSEGWPEAAKYTPVGVLMHRKDQMARNSKRTENDEMLVSALLAEVQRSRRILLRASGRRMESAKRNFRNALEVFSDLVLNGKTKAAHSRILQHTRL